MTTTVRSVRVELEASVGGYIRDMKLAGSETDRAFSGIESRISGTDRAIGGLEKSTQSLSKTSTQAKTTQAGLSREVEKTSAAASKGERSIDKYSGRLRLFAEVAATLGPSLIPIGALGIPAMAGLATQGGFAAAALGATVLAAQGVGDALKAVEAARLEPTAANLQAAQEAVHRLAPEAQDLVHHLEDLRDVGRGLQFTAAGGVLGGVDDALTSLETRLPQVQRILAIVSQGVGDAIRGGGDSLASSKYDAFFDFLQHEARPELDATADAVGNLAHGFASLFTGTVPLQRDFAGFLRSSTESFDEWATRLNGSDDFAEFVDYVRTNGPQVEETAGAIANSILQIVEAAAPLGGPTLQILEAVADVISAIADSPLGTPVFGALAAYSAYSRIFPVLERAYNGANVAQGRFETGLAKGPALAGRARAGVSVLATDLRNVARYGSLATESTSRLKGQLGSLAKGAAVAGGLAIATSGVADSMGLSNTASLALLGTIGGPWGAAVGGGIGLALDFAAANNDVEEAVNRANLALESGDYSAMAAALAEFQQRRKDIADYNDENVLQQVFDPTTYKRFSEILTGADDDAAQSQAELEQQMGLTRAAANLLAPALGVTAESLYDGASAARAFSGNLADFVGWLSKEEALRQYRDGLRGLQKELKNGFTRKDVDLLAAYGQNLAQVASQIKSPGKRAEFLETARSTLVDLAKHSGPEATAALDKLIRRLDQYGVTSPPPKKLKADPSDLEHKVNSSEKLLRELTGKPYQAKVTVDGGQALLTARQVKAALDAIHSRSVTVTVNQRGGVTSSAGGHSAGAADHAAGGYIDGPGTKTSDSIPARLSKGEYVVKASAVDRYGIGFMDAVNSQRFAGGGLVGSTYTSRGGRDLGLTQDTDPQTALSFHEAGDAADHAAGGLKKLDAQLEKLDHRLEKVQRSYDKERSKLDDLTSSRDSLASSVSGAYRHDSFGNGLAGLDAQLDADSGDLTEMAKALATLVANGLSPQSALYQALAASADVTTAQQLAALSAGDLASRAQRFDAVAAQSASFGLGVANDAASGVKGKDFVEAIRDQTKTTRQLDHRLHELADAIHDLKQLRKDVKDGAREGSREGSHEGSESGTRAGNNDRVTRTRAIVRSGGGG